MKSLFTTLLLTLILAVGSVQPATARCGWDVFSPNRSEGFFGVEGLSPTNVWTVGNRNTSGGGHRSLTEHWNGTTWSVVGSADTGSKDALLSNAMVAANDMWAVGNLNNAGLVQPLIEHWNGATWSIAPSPSFPNYATLIEAADVSRNDVWAVGFFKATNNKMHSLAEHWNGTSWTRVPTPVVPSADNFLFDVAVESPNSIWAVGYTVDSSGHSHALTEHWNGSAWSIVPSANGRADTILNGVAAPSPNDVWATGTFATSDGVIHTLAEHWNGTSWAIVATPDVNNIANFLSYLSSSGPSDVWSVGAYATSDNLVHTLVEHFNGTSWSIVPSPLSSSTINWRDDVKAFSPINAFVAGSFTGTDGIMHPFAEHYHC